MSKIVETTTTGLQQAVGRSVLAPVGTDDVTELGTYLKASGGGGGSGNEVPDVTAEDDGKVLTAAYSGGEGSYSWESIPAPQGVEMTANKVTSLSGSSTDTEYPSAKCVYDIVGYATSELEEVL